VIRALITGARGQLGRALVASAPGGVAVAALGHAELDIGSRDAVSEAIASVRPQVVINAAAYTAVDRAESDAEEAKRVNTDGVRNLAAAVRGIAGARLVHVSTNFVFDGRASTPYLPEAPPAPLSVYGDSKRGGELAALAELAERAVVVRTAWLYSGSGRNFVRKMLDAMAERAEVSVVADQVGTPTATRSFAAALWRCATSPKIQGLKHWTDAGVASWYDFACAIAEEAAALGLLRRAATVRPVATADWPTAAKRPAYGVLDTRSTIAALTLTPRHWRVELREVLQEAADA
jgi:dTDP-4-dehydrorhamnose reductase